jgi:hypothetical protein
VDDVSMLLERFTEAQTMTVMSPPVWVIEARAQRRSTLRSLTSLSVVLVLVIGLVIGLASAGMASERAPQPQTVTAAPASTR